MNQNRIRQINVHELKKVMDSQPNTCLIDVRKLDEWQSLHIPGAVHIPKDVIASKIIDIAHDKNQAIYLHCQAGKRSLIAAKTLDDLGYTNLYSIDGGIMDWASFGYPVKQ